MEEGKLHQADEGTPQGSILSPVLANVYLHYCLDLWFEQDFLCPLGCKKQAIAYCQLIRYADDVVATFQKKVDATMFETEVMKRLARFGLKISRQKSRTIPFGRYPFAFAQKQGRKLDTFDFLGFNFYCTTSRKGNFLLGRKTSKKKYRQKMGELKKWLKMVRNRCKLLVLVRVKEWWGILGRKLEGHYRYYGISGNMKEMQSYYSQAVSKTFKWVNRRSQKKSYNWLRVCRYLQNNPLPKPRIYHSYPVLW